MKATDVRDKQTTCAHRSGAAAERGKGERGGKRKKKEGKRQVFINGGSSTVVRERETT